MTLRLGLPAKLVPTDASDTRYDFRNLVVRNSDGTVRSGVTSPVAAGLALAAQTASTGPMTVAISAFDAVAVRDGGVVLLSNDGVVNVPMPAGAVPASNSQINVIYAMQHDASLTVSTPDADNAAGFYVALGSPAQNPTKPAIPSGAVEICTLQVPTGATASNSTGVVLTQTFQWTAMAGGHVPFPTLAALQLWTTAQPFQRAKVVNDPTSANNGEYIRSGTAWIQTWGPGVFRPFAEAVGTGTNPAGAFGPVTFPVGRFTVPPIITLQILGGGVAFPLISSVTKDGFSGGAFNASGAAVAGSWNWHAVQATATAAAG